MSKRTLPIESLSDWSKSSISSGLGFSGLSSFTFLTTSFLGLSAAAFLLFGSYSSEQNSSELPYNLCYVIES